jgi:hypothetical protein
MKFTVILLAGLLLSTTVFSQQKVNGATISDGQSLLEDIKSLRAYKKFVANYKKVEKGDVQEKLTAVGIIGARMHGLKEEYVFFGNYLKRNYPGSALADTVSLKNLSENCNTCQGEGTSAAACKKCKGNQACSNNSCTDGKVTGYDRVGGRFVAVQRDCTICKGNGQCVTCDGSGEALGSCSPCRQRGYLYSANKAVGVYEGLVQDILEDSQSINAKAFDVEMIAKGMVKIDGEWYRKEQIARMERDALQARKKADQAERRAMEVAEIQLQEEKAVSVLDRVDELVKSNPVETIDLLKGFIEKYPKHKKIPQFRKELSYADKYKSASVLEKNGAISKAIKKYQEAWSVKETDELKDKIKYLDDQTIGL